MFSWSSSFVELQVSVALHEAWCTVTGQHLKWLMSVPRCCRPLGEASEWKQASGRLQPTPQQNSSSAVQTIDTSAADVFGSRTFGTNSKYIK